MLTLLLACAAKPSDTAAWAVNYATVTPDAFGLSGHHVWVFFSDGWDRKRGSDYHVCTLLQAVEGSTIDDAEGCAGCVATYEVATEDLEHDCDDELVSDASYRGLELFSVGDVGDDLAADDPYPGDSLGWSISYDGIHVESHGWAYAEGHDWGGDVEDGWVEGSVYTLWPGYAWDLR